jgi:hypothetical protein
VNPKFRKNLADVIKEAGVPSDGLPKAKGNLLYYLAGKVRQISSLLLQVHDAVRWPS